MSRQRSEATTLPPGRLFATAPEAARLLRTDARTLRRALEAGTVPGFKVGATWRIPVAWLRQQAGLGDGVPAA